DLPRLRPEGNIHSRRRPKPRSPSRVLQCPLVLRLPGPSPTRLRRGELNHEGAHQHILRRGAGGLPVRATGRDPCRHGTELRGPRAGQGHRGAPRVQCGLLGAASGDQERRTEDGACRPPPGGRTGTKGGVMSAPQPPIIDQQTVEEIEEIKTLMAEAYRHALSIDGYAKSSEGRLSLDVLRPWYWRDGNSPRPEVSIYSYVLPLSGGGRQHYYDNATEALEDVRKAHAEVMKWNNEREGWAL